jgi:hypothetical protein
MRAMLLCLLFVAGCTSSQSGLHNRLPLDVTFPLFHSDTPIAQRSADTAIAEDDRGIRCPGGYAKTSGIEDDRDGTPDWRCE